MTEIKSAIECLTNPSSMEEGCKNCKYDAECDGDCDNCNHKDCDEHPEQKYWHRYSEFVSQEKCR